MSSQRSTGTVPPAIAEGAMANIVQPRVTIDDELALRPWMHGDTPSVLTAFGDPDIIQWHARRMTMHDEAIAWIEASFEAWNKERSANWAIVDVSNERVLGRTALHTQLEFGTAEIAYWVLPEARGRRVAARAAVAATAWGHAFGFHRIELEHSTRNGASCAVAQRAGFLAEGVKRASQRHTDGPHDMHLHSHLATDDSGRTSAGLT